VEERGIKIQYSPTFTLRCDIEEEEATDDGMEIGINQQRRKASYVVVLVAAHTLRHFGFQP
jgi:hypothetical protein